MRHNQALRTSIIVLGGVLASAGCIDAYPDEEVMVATHKHETKPSGWHVYPPAQIDATLKAALAARFPTDGPEDREAYTDAKADFIQGVLAAARRSPEK